jgi:pilus assembly protein Flp/PilA
MFTVLRNLWNDESGATAVEYGLMVALIAAVIITTVILLGQQVDTAFTTVTDGLANGGVAPAAP